jgi:hypothetical protein
MAMKTLPITPVFDHRRVPDLPRRAVLVQFSDLLLTEDSTTRDYYRRSYARMRGYHFPPHFMEIPYWIPIVCSMLPDHAFAKELMIVDDLPRARRELDSAGADDLFFFSAMDANIRQLLALAPSGATMLVGGYTDPADLAPYPNIRFLESVDDVARLVPGASPQTTLDYRLFQGLACIPRFSLSSGCSFRCAFCTVPTRLVLTDPGALRDEVAALDPLDYRLIFVDDKSFGDASNWPMLGQVGEWITERKPGFEGFIIQTPPSLAARDGFLDRCRDLGVRYVEFGVESVDDTILRYLRKPFRVRHLYRACEIARDLGLYVIPNLIMGIPGDDYDATLAWLREFVDIIPVVNVNWLATHFGNERGDLGLPSETVFDRDQNSTTKTWLSADQSAIGQEKIRQIYTITEEYWCGRTTYPANARREVTPTASRS